MLTIVLRLLHIVLGILWVGGAFFVAYFLFPSIRASGPAGGIVIREIAAVRKMPIYLAIIGWVSALSGLALYARNAMGTNNGWSGSRSGMTFGIGGLLAIIALLVGTFWNRPVADKVVAKGAQIQAAGTPPPANLVSEMAALQESLGRALTVVAVLLVCAAIAMSIARYL